MTPFIFGGELRRLSYLRRQAAHRHLRFDLRGRDDSSRSIVVDGEERASRKLLSRRTFIAIGLARWIIGAAAVTGGLLVVISGG